MTLMCCLAECANGSRRLMRRGDRAGLRASAVMRLLSVILLASAARGQSCDVGWLAGGSFPGVNGQVFATACVDPDGDGPRPVQYIVAGTFEIAGDTPASNIAVYDTADGAWRALGDGLDELVFAVTVTPGGEIIAGGRFTKSGVKDVSHVARWDGSSWLPLDRGLSDEVRELVSLPGGDVIAGGRFLFAGTTEVEHVARWDGHSWNAMGAGLNDSVDSLTVLPNQDVVAGGRFAYSGAVETLGVARWDGSQWSPIGSGIAAVVQAVAAAPDGELFAASILLGNSWRVTVSRWDGEAWIPMGDGIGGKYPSCNALAVTADHQLFAGGWYPQGNGDTWGDNLCRWNGSQWVTIGNMDGDAYSLMALPTGGLLIGGRFSQVGKGAVVLEGNHWSPLTLGLNDSVTAVAALPGGGMVAGGYFTNDGKSSMRGIARWDGVAWHGLGSGLSGDISDVGTLPNDDIVAAGSVGIVRWDGTAWVGFGTGLNGRVRAFQVQPSGEIIAGGDFTTPKGNSTVQLNYIARWDGVEWRPIGKGFNGRVHDVAMLPGGGIVAGGEFTRADGLPASSIAVWDGSRWNALGAGVEGLVRAVAVLPGGGIVAGGEFLKAGGASIPYIARWDGATWTKVGSSSLDSIVHDLAIMPNGDLVAGGRFSRFGRLARWNGNSWSGFGAGLTGGYPYVNSLDVSPDGMLLVGGDFEFADGKPSPFVARWSTTGFPVVAFSPQNALVKIGATATLSATPVKGFSGVRVQWRRGGVDVTDGPGGASPGGGTVTGASQDLASPTDGSPATLLISGAQPSDAGEYTAVFLNGCGSVTSLPATLSVLCPSDFDASGFVDRDDFDSFVGAYEAGDAASDFDGSGDVDDDDYAAFVLAFEAGC